MFLRGKYEYAFRPTWRKRSGFIGRADEKELFESALANLMAESRRETHEALWPRLAGDIPLAGKTVALEIRDFSTSIRLTKRSGGLQTCRTGQSASPLAAYGTGRLLASEEPKQRRIRNKAVLVRQAALLRLIPRAYFPESSSCFVSASSFAFASPASIVASISSPSAVTSRVFVFKYSG